MEALRKAIATGILGDSYVVSLLRQKDEPPAAESEYLPLKTELERYRARQRRPDYYDEILRYKKEVKNG